MKRLLSRAFGAAVVAVSCASANPAAAQDVVARRDALQLFNGRVTAYVAVHHRMNAVLPPWQPSLDMHLIEARRASLAAAIRRERRLAGQGDIFEPLVATVLRGTIADALRGVDVHALLRSLYDECQVPATYEPAVHAPLPVGATHEMPIVLLSALPALPAGIYYRLVNHDLLLWDADANLIIDVLPEALPRGDS